MDRVQLTPYELEIIGLALRSELKGMKPNPTCEVESTMRYLSYVVDNAESIEVELELDL